MPLSLVSLKVKKDTPISFWASLILARVSRCWRWAMGDVTAELIKIHLHTPSEHDLEGEDLGGEIHLIHRLSSPVNGSELLVVGVFFNADKTAAKSDLFSMWAAQVDPKSKVTTDSKGLKIDPRNLVPKNPNNEKWYRYEGSLTSEPYSEIVSSLVFVDPIGIESGSTQNISDLVRNSLPPFNLLLALPNF
jgi:carbonic anhydrase